MMLDNQEKIVGWFVSHEARRYYASTVRRAAESLEHKCANTRRRNALQKAQDILWSIWDKANHDALDASQTTSK
jgi:hypothetical protein